MKTQDELNTLKQELKDLSVKLNELSDEDLDTVVGGAVSKELLAAFSKIGRVGAVSAAPAAPAIGAPVIGEVTEAQGVIEKRELRDDDLDVLVGTARPLQK